MSQFKLTVATRANQASVLPVILVATSINEARPSPVISITYEDTALLHEGEKAVVQFTGVSGTPVYGTEKAIQELRQNFPFLTSKEGKLVNSPYAIGYSSHFRLSNFRCRKTSGLLNWSPSLPLTSTPLTLTFNVLMPTCFSDLSSLDIRFLRRTSHSGVRSEAIVSPPLQSRKGLLLT